jgi:hypothetical protein
MSEKPMNEMPVSMDCAAFEKVSHLLYRPEEAEAALCEAALAHAESCARCAALLTEVEWLEFSVLDLARHDTNREASPRMESALLQEFRRQKADAARGQIRKGLAALSVAAALFLALVLALRHQASLLHNSSSASPSAVAASNPQLSTAPGLPTVQVAATKVPEAPGAEQHLAPKKPAPSYSADSEYASAFVQLPYADDSATLDGGAVVRVSLSRSALASFGLPVADFASTDRVQADLIVGADGSPRAIRLVSQLKPSEEF